MAFMMQTQKSHGDQLPHPWLLVTIWVDSGAWMGPLKKEEAGKEIGWLHHAPLRL